MLMVDNTAFDNTPTFKVAKRPLPFRVADKFDRWLHKEGNSFVNLSEDFLVKSSMRRMKLYDLGDEQFREPLRMLLDSCEEEAGLDLFGRYLLSRHKILNLLCNRLLIEDEIKNHPEIINKPVTKPLFIVSLPRTGTTLLHNLLFQDPSNRCLRHWEVFAPSLHPNLRKKNRDPRINNVNRVIRLMHRYTPEILTAHSLHVEGPEECHYLLGLNFLCEATFDVLAHLPRYSAWVKTQSKIPTYRYYRKVLQLLQWHEPATRWVLKSPDHMSRLSALLAVFPDAGIIQIHRDPLKVIPSSCSLLALSRGIYSPTVDLASIGKETTSEMAYWLNQATNTRNLENSDRFFDIHYRDLVENPIGAVQRIYRYFGLEYDNRMDKKMSTWLAENRQHKKGVHRYSLDQFNLNENELNTVFEAYRDNFAIERE